MTAVTPSRAELLALADRLDASLLGNAVRADVQTASDFIRRLAANPSDPDAMNKKRAEDDAKLAANVRAATIAEIGRLSDEGSPNDIRALGWMVAVHNDYRQLGETHTFWLFTKDGRAVKGEGMSDAEALNKVRAALSPSGEPNP